MNFCNSEYDGILTYLWEELREIILIEMIMDKSRWFMWNFSLSGVMEALIYASKPWNSKQIHKKIMHLYELCM